MKKKPIQPKEDPLKEYKQLVELSLMSGFTGAANGAVAGVTSAAIDFITSKNKKDVKLGSHVRDSALIWGVSSFTSTSAEIGINKVTKSTGDLNRYAASAISAFCVSKLTKCNNTQTASVVAQNVAASFIFDSILIEDEKRVLNSKFSAEANDRYRDVISTLKKPITSSVDYINNVFAHK